MKCLIVFSALLALTVAYYPDTWDKYDADTAFADPEKLSQIIGCYLDEAPCDPANEFFKQYVPDAIKTGCSNCSPAEKHMVHKFFEYAEKYYPERVAQIWAKYDHDAKWKEAYLASVKDS